MFFEYLFCEFLVSVQLGLHHVLRTSMFVLEEAVFRLPNAVTDKMTVQTDLMRSVWYMHKKKKTFVDYNKVFPTTFICCLSTSQRDSSPIIELLSFTVMTFQTKILCFFLQHIKSKTFLRVL